MVWFVVVGCEHDSEACEKQGGIMRHDNIVSVTRRYLLCILSEFFIKNFPFLEIYSERQFSTEEKKEQVGSSKLLSTCIKCLRKGLEQ